MANPIKNIRAISGLVAAVFLMLIIITALAVGMLITIYQTRLHNAQVRAEQLNIQKNQERIYVSSDPEYVYFKNIGEKSVTIKYVVLKNQTFTLYAENYTLAPGETYAVEYNEAKEVGIITSLGNYFFTATTGRKVTAINATLYILNCSDANGWWITGYTAQSLAEDLYNMLSPHFRNTVMVNNTTQLGQLLNGSSLHGESLHNAVIINTFGEAVPIPADYITQGYDSEHNSYAKYCYLLGRRVRQYNWTWVSVVGYPFYYVTNTRCFSNESNSWGIYGAVSVEAPGLNAFLQGLDDQEYVYDTTWIAGNLGLVNLTSEAQRYGDYYCLYPSPHQVTTRALPGWIQDKYNLMVTAHLFDEAEGYYAGAIYRHIATGETNITGSLFALGVASPPDIRLVALGLLLGYTPKGLQVEYQVALAAKFIVLQLNWNSTFYSNLSDATIVVEYLQNGTIRWLGKNLQITTRARPIPQVPVKNLRVNETINGVNREVPFQVEDWVSNYRIPLGLASNKSVFNSRKMLVFLVNPNVSKVTIWWDRNEDAVQTPYAIYNPNTSPFKNDDPDKGLLTNGILNLTIIHDNYGFKVVSTLGDLNITASFMRVNGESSQNSGRDPVYVIFHGIVRDIILQPVQWDGGADGCPDVYAYMVFTLPANASYYTYQLRMIFLESNHTRTLYDLSLIKLNATVAENQWGSYWNLKTENGTSTGYPITSAQEGFYYNFSNVWQHHWSELIGNNSGFGVMMTTEENKKLYLFDPIAENNTGGLSITTQDSGDNKIVTIEIKPVSLAPASFQSFLDVTWYGVVALFDGEKQRAIYSDTDAPLGLWVTVEYPPTVTVESYGGRG